MSKADLILYTRPDCHLCEVAAGLLDAQGCGWSRENIENDLGLIRRYGDKVPVLYRPADGAELLWPFGAEELRWFTGLPR